MRVAIVYNPISGSGRGRVIAERLQRELQVAEVDATLVETQPTQPTQPTSTDAAGLVAPAGWLDQALAGVDAAVVAGGDGAVRLVAPRAAALAVPLWHAPSGTENLFARAFGMTASGAAIAASLGRMRAGGGTTSIDLATANGEPFVLMASVGFDADVVHHLASVRRGGITHLSYVAPILRTSATWQPPALSWAIDGEHEPLGDGMVVVGNLPDYGMRLNPAAAACPHDGQLDAVFLPARSALELALWVPLLRTGLHRSHPALRERRGRVIELFCAHETRVQLDGDAALGAGGVRRLRATVGGPQLQVMLPG